MTRAPPAHIEAPRGAQGPASPPPPLQRPPPVPPPPQHQRRRRVRHQHHRHAGNRAPASRPVRQPDRGQGARGLGPGRRPRGAERVRELRRAPPPGAFRRDGVPRRPAPRGRLGEGEPGQSQPGNKEAYGGGAQPCVRWPQLASQLAHCPLRAHKESLPLPARCSLGELTPAGEAEVVTRLRPRPHLSLLAASCLSPHHASRSLIHLAGGQVAARKAVGGRGPREAGAGLATCFPSLCPYHHRPSSFGR